MANEAVIIELLGKVPGRPIKFTCAAAAMPKGTICTVTDPRTAAASAADNDPFVGIAAMENDGTETSISLYTHGIFDLVNTNAAAIAAGYRVQIEAANSFGAVDAAGLLFSDIGIVLEDAAKQETAAVLIGSLL